MPAPQWLRRRRGGPGQENGDADPMALAGAVTASVPVARAGGGLGGGAVYPPPDAGDWNDDGLRDWNPNAPDWRSATGPDPLGPARSPAMTPTSRTPSPIAAMPPADAELVRLLAATGQSGQPWGVGADPGAATQVVALQPPSPAGPGPDATAPEPLPAPQPLVRRAVAAEIGLYVGACMAVVAALAVAAGGWDSWSLTTRVACVAAAGLGATAWGAWLALSGGELAGPRRRLVSTLLAVGTVVLAGGASVWVADLGAEAPHGVTVTTGVGMALALGVNLLARTPASELVALGWAGALLVSVGQWLGEWLWPALLALGVLWAVLGWRWFVGRRTAVVAGGALALFAGAAAAAGAEQWAWPARAAIAVVGALALIRFLRGGPNAWLALGAGCAAALAGSLAGTVVGPLLALLLGGLATCGVSYLALRSARRESATDPVS